MRVALLVLMLVLVSAAASAQYLDPDRCWTCSDSFQHAAAGAALDGAAIAVFPRWRPWQRALLTGVLIGGVFEAGQADAARHTGKLGQLGYGFGLKDWACDVAGALVLEGAWALARRIFR